MFLSHSVVDCGQPASAEDTLLLSVTGTTYGSVAMFACDEGFVWRSGGNSSVCGADGLWRGPTMVCEGNKTQENKELSDCTLLCFLLSLLLCACDIHDLERCVYLIVWLFLTL